MKPKSFLRKFFTLRDVLVKKFYIKYNKFIFWINDIEYGDKIYVYNHVYIKKHPTAQISIGNNFTFTSGYAINPLCRNIYGCIYAPKNSIIKIGDNTGISSACIWAKEKIIIGDNVRIGGDCIIMDTDAHNLDYKIRTSRKQNVKGESIDVLSAKSKPIIIENDVLIGTRCIILKGVTIGARSIIGSGSVVTKSIPADCIAAGNPCKVIKYINTNKDI